MMAERDEPDSTVGTAGAATAAPLLSVRNLGVRFGGIVALDDVSFDLARGQILGLIGPNGAGKTTLFNCLSRLYRPATGDILLEGRSILGLGPHRMAALGLGRTFQNLALFRSRTVAENVLVGAHPRGAGGYLSDALALARSRTSERQLAQLADEAIAYLDLGSVRDRPVAGLPFGTLKRIELARALAGAPKILLLDEPAGGLNHEEVAELAGSIRRIRDERGITVLLVEHHMGLVMSVSDTVVALNFGRKIAEGPPDAVRQNPELVRAYLGSGAP